MRYLLAWPIFLLVFSVSANGQFSGAIYESIHDQFQNEEFEKILDRKTEALALAKMAQDSAAANIFGFIGFSHYMVGEVDSAITFFERELVLREGLKAIAYTDFSNSMYNLMSVYNQAGMYSEAITTGLKLMSEDKAHFGVKSQEYGDAVMFYLRALSDQGDFSKAKQEAERLMKEVGGESEFYPMLQNKYADALAGLGEYSRAEKEFVASIKGIRAFKDASSLVSISMSVNMANLMVDQGEFVQAEEIYSQAAKELLASDEPEARELYYSCISNLAIALLKLSRTDEAVRYFSELVQHDKETFGTDHPVFIQTLNNAGNAFTDAGDFGKAQGYLESALQLERATDSLSYQYASLATNLAKLLCFSGQARQSLPLLTKAAAIFEKQIGKQTLEHATTVYLQGVAYMMLKSPKAKDKLAEALAARQSLFGINHPKVGETHSKLAIYEWMMGNKKEALAHFTATFANYYQQIERYFPGLSEAEKTKFYYTGLRPSFEIFNSFAVQEHTGNKAILGQLYDVQLNTKGLILYSTNKVRTSLQKNGDRQTLARYEEWLALKEQISKLYAANDESQANALDSLERTANEMERELTKKSASFEKNVKRKWNNWKDVQAKLASDEVAIEMLRFRDYTPDSGGYYTGSVKYGALLVRKSSKFPELIMVPNPGNKMERQNLSFYRNAIKFEMNDPHSYNIFWKPLADQLKGVKKVYFSPDGIYNQINLNSLQNPSSGKYVLEELIIENVTNTKDIVERTVGSSASPKSVHLYGFPQYAISTQQAASEAPADGVTRKIHRGERAGILRFLRGENGIVTLPGTKDEVQKIQEIVTASNRKPTVLLGTQAQENSLKGLEQVDLLHVATHGFFLDDPDFSMMGNADKYIENPLLRTGLIMAGAEDYLRTGLLSAEGEQDGILTASEVMDLSLEGASLVVLSACETGLGTIQNGEGVYGLRRAFQIAGARSLVMSMWSVDDEATQALMTAFYANWIKGESKQAAFRKAQLQLKEKYPNPFFWGAFVMVGE